jgi:hypothetical protein
MTSTATKKKIELYSLDYYAACTLGGILACVRILCNGKAAG